MKGKISPQLETILRDRKARDQLKNHLISGNDGQVVANNTTYAVHVEVRSTDESSLNNSTKGRHR
jgi:hypothetical protein